MPEAQYMNTSWEFKGRLINGNESECVQCGGIIFRERMRQHNLYHEQYAYTKDTGAMSNVLWCDNGDHAYKAGQPGSISFNAEQYDENGAVQQVKQHACADHNPFKKQYQEAQLAALTEQAADELKRRTYQ